MSKNSFFASSITLGLSALTLGTVLITRKFFSNVRSNRDANKYTKILSSPKELELYYLHQKMEEEALKTGFGGRPVMLPIPIDYDEKGLKEYNLKILQELQQDHINKYGPETMYHAWVMFKDAVFTEEPSLRAPFTVMLNAFHYIYSLPVNAPLELQEKLLQDEQAFLELLKNFIENEKKKQEHLNMPSDNVVARIDMLKLQELEKILQVRKLKFDQAYAKYLMQRYPENQIAKETSPTLEQTVEKSPKEEKAFFSAFVSNSNNFLTQWLTSSKSSPSASGGKLEDTLEVRRNNLLSKLQNN